MTALVAMIGRLARSVAVLALIASLGGCAGLEMPQPPGADGSPGHGLRIAVPASELAALERAPSCCASLATLPYRSFPREGRLTLDLDTDTPVFDFETGRSRFVAFRLPDLPRPFELEVVSRVSALRPDFMALRTVFNPSIAILDAEHRIVRRLQAPEDFAVRGPEPGQTSIEVRGRAWIDEPPERAAYLVLLTTDALRARSVDARGIDVVGFSPGGVVDLSLQSVPFLTPPVRFRALAHASDPGSALRLSLHEDLLVVDARGVQFAERRDGRLVPVRSIPFERIVAVRLENAWFAGDRLIVTWLDGDVLRAHRFGLVPDPGQSRATLQPVLPAIAEQVRPGWRRETIAVAVEEAVPEILFVDPPVGEAASGRIRDSAMTGGALTAGICGLCFGGTCPPQVLASCAGLFAVGAAVGTVMGVGRELAATGGRPAPVPVLPSQEVARSQPRVRSGASTLLSPTVLAGCLRRADSPTTVAPDAGLPNARSAAGQAPWWSDQGRSAQPTDDPSKADFVLRVALSRIELVGQATQGGGTADAQVPVRLSVVARVALAPPGAASPAPAVEVRWDGPVAPLQRWSEPDGATVTDTLQSACAGLADAIRRQAQTAWQAAMPGAAQDDMQERTQEKPQEKAQGRGQGTAGPSAR